MAYIWMLTGFTFIPNNVHFAGLPTMTDVKNAITLLCKHLNFFFNMNIKAEMFRLAKYNKSDDNVVEIFWTLLKNIIDLPATDNVVQNVKRYFLLELKYECVQFYSLPENMSCGSRELLIAFGYLLAISHVDALVKKALENSFLNPNFQVISNNTQHKAKNYSFGLKQLITEEDVERAIQWIEGRISSNKRAVLEYNNSLEKMASKLSKTTLTTLPTIEQLSLSEVLALNNKEYAKTFLEKTECILKILQNHGRWLKNQSVFWEWLESSLLERQKDVRIINTEELDKFLTSLN